MIILDILFDFIYNNFVMLLDYVNILNIAPFHLFPQELVCKNATLFPVNAFDIICEFPKNIHILFNNIKTSDMLLYEFFFYIFLWILKFFF